MATDPVPERPGAGGDRPRHANTERVVAVLRAAGADGAVRTLPDAATTAVAAAAQLGVDVGAIANSLVFDADDTPLLILTSGAHRVDTQRVARLLGVDAIRRATPDFVRAATGQSIGGVAPIGHPAPVRTLVDTTLRAHPAVWAAAGTAHTVFATTFDELVRITGGTPTEVGD